MPGFISHVNRALLDLDGRIDAFASGGASASVDSAFPATNALNPDPSLVTRWNITHPASGGAVTLRAQMSSSANVAPVRIVYLANVRTPASGFSSIQCRLANFSGATLATAPQSYTAANLAPIPGTTDRFNLAFVFAAETACAMVDIDLNGLSGSVVRQWEVGYWWAGPAVLLDVGVQYDLRLSVIDGSSVARGRSGAFAATKLPARRRLEARVLPQSNVRSIGDPGTPAAPSLRSVFQEVGVASPVVFLPDDSSTHRLQVQGMYCALASAAALQGERGGFFSAPLELDEIR